MSHSRPLTRWETGQPSYEQMQRAVQEMYAACGVLFAALTPFSGPRNLINMGGQPAFLLTTEERNGAYSARMEALRRISAAGLTPPLGPQPAPPTVPMVPRQTHYGPR